MASFGHSGSHTSQLMHSSVIISATDEDPLREARAHGGFDGGMDELRNLAAEL